MYTIVSAVEYRKCDGEASNRSDDDDVLSSGDKCKHQRVRLVDE
jgi:hypothetical protein